MKATGSWTPFIIPFDDEHAAMMDYARSSEGQAKIAEAQAEIDAGEGIVADEAYFEALNARLVQRARKRIEEVISSGIDREPKPDENNRAEEEATAESVKAFRRRNRHD